MRIVLAFVLIQFSIFSQAQSYKEILAKAYHCTSDSCFNEKLEESKPFLTTDTAKAFVDYIKYFYLVKTNRLDSADTYYDRVQAYDKKIENWSIYFNTLSVRNITLTDRGQYDRAAVELKVGIELANQLKLDFEKGLLYTALSYVYHNMGLYQEGVNAGKSAWKLLDTTTIHYPDLINAINTIAINYDDWGQPDSALHYHFMNVEIGLDKTEVSSASSTYNNIGNTFMKMNKLDSAEKYLIKSVNLAKSVGAKSSLATALTNLGEIGLRKGEYKLSKEYLDSALYYSEINKLSPHEKRRDVYRVLYKYYEEIGDMANAFLYHSKYISYRDTMHNLNQIEKLKNLEIQTAKAEKDKEIAERELEVKNRNILIIGIVSLLLLTLAFVRQLYLKRQQTAQQSKLKLHEERLRISRDLHDNIGAELTYISSVIDLKVYGMKDPEEKREYERLSNSSRNAMSQLRETIWAIKTEEITNKRFAEKLEELCEKYSEGLGVQLSVNHSGENYLLPPAKVISLFRVCQEAINNAIKYSGCDSIVIELNAENNVVNLQIVDNGKGFDTELSSTGSGLQNMRERIEEIGGVYHLKSVKDKGTTIQIQLPI